MHSSSSYLSLIFAWLAVFVLLQAPLARGVIRWTLFVTHYWLYWLTTGSLLLQVPVDTSYNAQRQAEVARINAIPNISWTAGLNSRWRNLPLGASTSLCGVKPGGKSSLRDRVKAGTMQEFRYTGVSIPDSFDSATNWPKW